MVQRDPGINPVEYGFIARMPSRLMSLVILGDLWDLGQLIEKRNRHIHRVDTLAVQLWVWIVSIHTVQGVVDWLNKRSSSDIKQP